MKRITTPRMTACTLLAVALLALIGLISPQQLPVIIYKASLLTLAGTGGYWLDRWLFPYARPDRWLIHTGVVDLGMEQVFAAVQIRRAIVVGSAMLAVGLAL